MTGVTCLEGSFYLVMTTWWRKCHPQSRAVCGARIPVWPIVSSLKLIYTLSSVRHPSSERCWCALPMRAWHMLTYRCTTTPSHLLPPSLFRHDLKDTQSTFTGALMALQPMLLPPPFLLCLLLLLSLFPLLLMSSAGLALLYRGVINHATGSSSASNLLFWFQRAGLPLQAKTICSFFIYLFFKCLGETVYEIYHMGTFVSLPRINCDTFTIHLPSVTRIRSLWFVKMRILMWGLICPLWPE